MAESPPFSLAAFLRTPGKTVGKTALAQLGHPLKPVYVRPVVPPSRDDGAPQPVDLARIRYSYNTEDLKRTGAVDWDSPEAMQRIMAARAALADMVFHGQPVQEPTVFTWPARPDPLPRSSHYLPPKGVV